MDQSIGANKAVAGGAAGALVTIAAYAAQMAFGIEIPAEIAAAATTLVSTAAVYLTPHTTGQS